MLMMNMIMITSLDFLLFFLPCSFIFPRTFYVFVNISELFSIYIKRSGTMDFVVDLACMHVAGNFESHNYSPYFGGKMLRNERESRESLNFEVHANSSTFSKT